MATAAYFLCALTSTGCAVLLIRSWWASRVRLLMWCALGFTGLALNNLLLFLDRVVLPERDLGALRDASGLLGISILLLGLIWESR
jgi:Family of unknown function (DUF5985)